MAIGKIGQDDARYADLVRKNFNKRAVGRPDHFYLARSTADVIEAVEAAVRDKRRVVVRSGGHCLETFVSDPEVRVVIDLSLMTVVEFDADRCGFAVDAGVTLGEAYRKLFLGWGVLIPAGESPDIGVGGHVLGGAFGFLCRQHGLAVDHLFAVEVVVVDETGAARSVVATRADSDPHRELWWAHTGGGGGNFGIVTRYWFRSPGAVGNDPTRLLPTAPARMTTFKAEWTWPQLDEATFASLVRNYEGWCARNVGADAASAQLFSVLSFGRPPHGSIVVRGVVSAGGPAAERLVAEHLDAINEGTGAAPTRQVAGSSWLEFALNPFPDLFAIGPGGVAASLGFMKLKDAFLRRPHNDRQIAVMYDYLTRRYPEVAGGAFGFATYGGRVNTVASDATASAQRAAILTTSYSAGWQRPEEELQSLTWVRELYRDIFADTGGVPVPDDANDGALINHPDADLADPRWNRSQVPWSTIYYKGNYPRLQKVKQRWDPSNVFHHRLSIVGARHPALPPFQSHGASVEHVAEAAGQAITAALHISFSVRSPGRT